MRAASAHRDARMAAIPERLTRAVRVGWVPDRRDRGFLAYLALFCAALLGIELAGLQELPAVGAQWWLARHADAVAVVGVAAVAVLPMLRTGQGGAVIVLDDTVARIAWPWPLPRERMWRPAAAASLRRHLVGGLAVGLVVGLLSWSLLGASVAGAMALGALTASGAVGNWAVRARRQVARTGAPAWLGKIRWGVGTLLALGVGLGIAVFGLPGVVHGATQDLPALGVTPATGRSVELVVTAVAVGWAGACAWWGWRTPAPSDLPVLLADMRRRAAVRNATELGLTSHRYFLRKAPRRPPGRLARSPDHWVDGVTAKALSQLPIEGAGQMVLTAAVVCAILGGALAASHALGVNRLPLSELALVAGAASLAGRHLVDPVRLDAWTGAAWRLHPVSPWRLASSDLAVSLVPSTIGATLAAVALAQLSPDGSGGVVAEVAVAVAVAVLLPCSGALFAVSDMPSPWLSLKWHPLWRAQGLIPLPLTLIVLRLQQAAGGCGAGLIVTAGLLTAAVAAWTLVRTAVELRQRARF